MNRIIPASEIQKNSIRNGGKSFHARQIDKVNWQSLQIDRLNASVNRMQSEFRNLSFQYSAVEKSFCDKNKGSMIDITFLNKKTLQGKFIDSDKYCFFLDDGNKPILVLKSGVAFIKPLS